MASFETVDFLIRPEDGWVLVASDPSSVIVRPAEYHPWWVAVTDGVAPPSEAAVKAAGSVVFAGQPSDTETVTIGSITYTFVSALAVANDVLIGADAAATRNNLVAAINGAAGVGVTYGTGTVANADVTAQASGADAALAAAAAGPDGNDLAISEAATNVTVTGFAGGAWPIEGLAYGRGSDGLREDFRVDTTIAGDVYIRIKNAPASSPGSRMRFGVIRNQ